jgi:RHS repeat-associated protein
MVEREVTPVARDRRYLWDGGEIVEERDGVNASVVTKRYFGAGVQEVAADAPTNLFYSRDHLGSVREVTDANGALVARYDYDAWGRRTQVFGTYEADWGYAGYFVHHASRLNLTWFRAYDADLGRWVSRDPIAEQGGLNLYQYVDNSPINLIDPNGLIHQAWNEAPYDGRLHDDEKGGLEVLCNDDRTLERDTIWLDHSIRVREVEQANFRDIANLVKEGKASWMKRDNGRDFSERYHRHEERLRREKDTRERCKKRKREKEFCESTDYSWVPEDWLKDAIMKWHQDVQRRLRKGEPLFPVPILVPIPLPIPVR